MPAFGVAVTSVFDPDAFDDSSGFDVFAETLLDGGAIDVSISTSSFWPSCSVTF